MKKVISKDCFGKLKKHVFNGKSGTYFAVILCVEILFLSILLVSGISKPKSEMDYPLSDFSCNDSPNIEMNGNNLSFSPTDGISSEQVQTVPCNTFSLGSGAYQFCVSYESNTDGTHNFSKSTGEITLISKNHEIETDTLRFDDAHNLVVGRFWIPTFSRCDDLHFIIRYNGQGTLKIHNCHLAEYKRFRLIRFLGFMGAFILLDIFLLMFFTNYSLKVNKRVAAVVTVAFVSSIPFIGDTLCSFGYNQDLWFHLNRIVALSDTLFNGQFPARMATEVNNGYSYPNSLYYCDIFLYLPAILYRFRVPLRVCYQLYVIVVNVFTGIFTYYAMSKFTKKEELRFLGTALYMLCLYRLTNVLIRSAAGEYTAMCFLPLIVVGIYNIIKNDKCTVLEWFPLAAGMAGVIMSHIVTAEMLAINIAILCIIIFPSILRLGKVSAILKAVITGVLMTVWFLVPFVDSAIHHKTLVQTEDLRMLGRNTQSWLSLLRILAPGVNGGKCESLGLSFVFGIIVILYCLYCTKKSRVESEDTIATSKIRLLALFAFINVIFVSRYFPWNRIQNLLGVEKLGYQLGTIQFSWRFLSISAILISITSIVAMDYIYEYKKHVYSVCVISMSVCIVFGCGYFYYKTYDYAEQIKASNVMSYTKMDSLYYLEGTDESIVNFPACKVQEGNAEFSGYDKVNGTATVYVKNHSQESEAKVSVPIFAYNHYHVYELRENKIVGELTYGKDENNCILITIPAGFDGNIKISFVEPKLWRVAEIVSLLAWIIISCKLLLKVRRKKGHINLSQEEVVVTENPQKK